MEEAWVPITPLPSHIAGCRSGSRKEGVLSEHPRAVPSCPHHRLSSWDRKSSTFSHQRPFPGFTCVCIYTACRLPLARALLTHGPLSTDTLACTPSHPFPDQVIGSHTCSSRDTPPEVGLSAPLATPAHPDAPPYLCPPVDTPKHIPLYLPRGVPDSLCGATERYRGMTSGKFCPCPAAR